MRTVIANWKMNPETVEEAKRIFSGIKRISTNLKRTQVVVAPPTLFAPLFVKAQHKKLVVAAQDTWYEQKGSFTGQISPTMLVDAGVSSTIIGHSERRALGETNELIQKKVIAALKAGLGVTLCIGETTRDADGSYFNGIRTQLASALTGLPRVALAQLVIAYEPVWAIGAIEPMNTHDIHSMMIFIKKTLGDIFTKDVAKTIPIVYGGSVFAENAAEIIEKGGVQGLLVGRESLTNGFLDLLKIVDAVK